MLVPSQALNPDIMLPKVSMKEPHLIPQKKVASLDVMVVQAPLGLYMEPSISIILLLGLAMILLETLLLAGKITTKITLYQGVHTTSLGLK